MATITLKFFSGPIDIYGYRWKDFLVDGIVHLPTSEHKGVPFEVANVVAHWKTFW